MGLAVGLKAAAAGVGTLGVATLLQVVGDAPEPLTTALQHSAGAGAFATVAVWLVLKGRVDGHGAQLKKLEDGQSQMAVKLEDVGEGVAYLRGREKQRDAGLLRTRRSDNED